MDISKLEFLTTDPTTRAVTGVDAAESAIQRALRNLGMHANYGGVTGGSLNRWASLAVLDPVARIEALASHLHVRASDQLTRDHHLGALGAVRHIAMGYEARDFTGPLAHGRHWPSQSVAAWAIAEAQKAQAFAFPAALEPFRVGPEALAIKLAKLHEPPGWTDGHSGAFARTMAVANAVGTSLSLDTALHDAARAFAAWPIPKLRSLSGYESFLDAAGLILPRGPRLRRVSAAAKRKRLQKKLAAARQPRHVREAVALVHSYELALRQTIDDVMTTQFGSRWAEERLPLCDCKPLLGKWRTRGGELLDHADFADYERIMCNPEHHAVGFAGGFPDITALARVLADARRLRAASHHPKSHPSRFTPQDLAHLRLTFRLLKVGLVALESDWERDD
jgi:hypothetical protein